MTHTDDTVRTRPDGSIDTGYYMARGRHMRSKAAHALVQPSPDRRRPRRGLSRLFGSNSI